SERFSAPVHESRIHLVSLNRPLSRDARETGNRPLSQQKKGTFGSLLKIPGYPRSWPLLLHLLGQEAGGGLSNFYFQFPHDYPRLFGCQDDGANRVALRNDRGDYLGRKLDRKSTRLNSSHVKISYAVFCLKKKTQYP